MLNTVGDVDRNSGSCISLKVWLNQNLEIRSRLFNLSPCFWDYVSHFPFSLATMATHYPITGIKVDDPNNVQSRFEIQEWYQKAISGTNSEAALQLSLFLHALERFQDEKFLGANVKEKDAQLSYFRVAGISQFFWIRWI
jgi:hypothetical protein